MHSYLWSSADVGDAHLVDTDPSETLEEAIAALKANINELFQKDSFHSLRESLPLFPTQQPLV